MNMNRHINIDINADTNNRMINQRMIDQNEIRTMQIAVMLMLSIGYIADSWQIIAAQVVIFLLTIISPSLNPFILLYRFVLRPFNLVQADWRDDNIEAHRFASMIGFTISAAASYFLYMGLATIGWGLVGLILAFGVFALSGWCAGCFAYYMIQKTGHKGYFKHAPIDGAFPGARPPKAR